MPARRLRRPTVRPGAAIRDRRPLGPGDLLVPRPVPWWRRVPRTTRRAASLACVLLAVTLTAHLAADAAADRRAWGDAVPAVVLRRAVPAGRVLGADDLATRSLPRALLPEGALDPASADGSALGRVAATDLAAGEVLLTARLAPHEFSPERGVGPRGRTIAVPLDVPAPPVATGDRIDLLAPGSPLTDAAAAGRTPSATVVAEDAVVVAVEDAALVVAVAGPDVPRVVAALLEHAVVAVARPR